MTRDVSQRFRPAPWLVVMLLTAGLGLFLLAPLVKAELDTYWEKVKTGVIRPAADNAVPGVNSDALLHRGK